MPISVKDAQHELAQYREKIDSLRVSLDLDNKRERLETLESEINSPEVWGDAERMASLNREKRRLENSLKPFETLMEQIDELSVLVDFLKEGEVIDEELEQISSSLDRSITDLEFQKMLGGKMDPNNAIINLNAGAGGRESQDWAVMLSRMYTRWAERRGFTIEVADRVTGDDAAGIKSVTLIIQGDYAYGYLKAESGVHRLVRISPFDSNKRRHTSFCSVFVTPEVDDSIDIDIDESDLKIDTFRASGAGGQHVNTTDSAVRITHIPTNTIAQCQSERSQHKNRATAMKILKSKLYELELKKKMEDVEEKEKMKMGINFGSQIRSYVLHPYKMVKDHRTDHETGNAEAVLNGDELLDKFMEDYLMKYGGGDEVN